MMDADQVIEDIRSCLISSKGAVPISQMNRDYKMIVGQAIPYAKYGYTTLESFLKSVPGLNVYPVGGELVMDAMPTRNTSHIAALVRGQKSSGPRRRVVSSKHGFRNLRGFRTPLTAVQTPQRQVTLPSKQPSPTRKLTSLSKANLPPRLKFHSSQIPGQRKGQDTFLSLDIQKSIQQESNGCDAHGDGSDVHSPMSSVLRTPTGVLGQKSPLMDLRPSSDEMGMAGILPSLMSLSFKPVVTPRTSAQARISRQVSAPGLLSDSSVNMMMSPQFCFPPLQPLSPGVTSGQLQSPGPVSPGKTKMLDYCKMLATYCKAKQLPDPVYKIIPSFPKSKTKQIVCSIKVGPETTSTSYPAECRTEKEAQEVAAQDILRKLQETYGALGESLPVTTDENLLVVRVTQMLDEHPNGLWSFQIPASYRALHKEILPEGWLDMLRCSPLITIDRAVHDRFILLPNKASSAKGYASSRSPSSTELVGSLFLKEEIDEASEIKEVERVTDPGPRKAGEVIALGHITLPEDEYWNVYVSYATSTSNIWVRLIGEEYSALYDDMAAEMEMYYMNGGIVAENLTPGHFYALQVDKCWHRVEVLEVNEATEGPSGEECPKSATCFFVDNGDDDVIETSKFRVLDDGFTKLPCQAVQCRLTGLEDFASDVVESLLVEKIMGRNLVGRPCEVSAEDYVDGRPYPSLTLYDTSTDENVNLNEVLLERILNDVVPPCLLKNGKIQEAYVSYISKTGALYVQLPSNIFDYIAKSIDEYSSNMTTDGECNPGKIAAGVTAVHLDVMYLARYVGDMVWYRAIKDVTFPGVEDGKVWVKFVDYGNSELTSLKNLVVLPSSSKLCKLPYQAIECRLHNMPTDLHFTEKGLRRCHEIIPSEEPVLLKVISTVTDSDTGTSRYDIVEIFKRVQPDNLLASVSTTLSVEEGTFEKVNVDLGLQGVVGEGSNGLQFGESVKSNKIFPKATHLPPTEPENPRTLPAPKVPKVGELFDVHVTIAANPGNFTVQPWKDANDFSELMTAMQHVYAASSSKDILHKSFTPDQAETYRRPLQRSQVKEGGVYAALHDDQLWYRISVSKLIDVPIPEEGMASAYFVDFGDVAVMTLDKLRELAPEFYNVPYQAIKAKLAGVAPVHLDWSVEDCLRFQEMVCDKQFVSTIVEMGPDLIDPSDTVIGIHLTDTSDPKVDASIGQMLIEEGRALSC